MSEFSAKVREERLARGLKQSAFAGIVGVDQSTVSRWERDKQGPDLDALNRLSQALGVDFIGMFKDQVAEAAAPMPGRRNDAGVYVPPPAMFGRRDLKVFSAVEGGPGEISWGHEPIDVIPRPWNVENVDDAYGVVVTGESMVPVVRPGQLVVVHPRLAPVPHELAVFIHDPDGPNFKATIKEMRRSTPRDWLVYQYNPAEGQMHDFALPKADWPKGCRVMGVFPGR